MTDRSLDRLRPGQWGRVVAIHAAGELRGRLADMGLTPGVEVLLRRIAPFGDPLEISLRGYELSLRRADAKNVLVRPIAPGWRR